MEVLTAKERSGGPPALPLRLAGDKLLARLAARGHASAFDAIFRRYQQPLYRYCRSMLGNSEDARDALQNTMTRMLRALPGESRDIALKPWLYRIAHNEALRIASHRRPASAIEEIQELPDASEEQRHISREEIRALMTDLKDLSERQRAALVMRELAGLRYDEIGATFQVTEAAAKQSVYEARSALLEMTEGRDMACAEVRRTLSDNDGRALRGRKLRAHVRACPGCRAFQDAMGRRPAVLNAATPALPATAAAGLLAGLGQGGAHAASGAASAALGVGVGVGAPTAAMTGVAKVLVAAALIVSGGAVVGAELEHSHPASRGITPSAEELRASGGEGGSIPASQPATGIAGPSAGAGSAAKKGHPDKRTNDAATGSARGRSSAGSSQGRSNSNGGRGNSSGQIDRGGGTNDTESLPRANQPNPAGPQSTGGGDSTGVPGSAPKAVSPKQPPAGKAE